jgi:hypothetical protein
MSRSIGEAMTPPSRCDRDTSPYEWGGVLALRGDRDLFGAPRVGQGARDAAG